MPEHNKALPTSLVAAISAFVSLLFAAPMAHAQTSPGAAAMNANKKGAEDGKSADLSGTDPTKFIRTFTFRNELFRFQDESWLNTTSLTFIEPFADGKVNTRLKIPFSYTDVTGDDDFGLGDLSLRLNWLADVTPQYGLLLGVDSTWDTASERALGRDTNVVAPLVTLAWFVNKNVIFAPSYQHNIGFGGGPDVNESVVDLYFVFTADDKKTWLQVDPAIVYNWETETLGFSLETTVGRKLGNFGPAAVNGFIAPSVGIGDDRPFDWGLEVGISIVGW